MARTGGLRKHRREYYWCILLIFGISLLQDVIRTASQRKTTFSFGAVPVKAFSSVGHQRYVQHQQRTTISKREERPRTSSAVQLESTASEAYWTSLSEFTASTAAISSTESYLNSLSRFVQELEEHNHALAEVGAAASSTLYSWNPEDSFSVMEDDHLFPELEEAVTASLTLATAEQARERIAVTSLDILNDDDDSLVSGTEDNMVGNLGAPPSWASRFASIQWRAMQVGHNYLSRQSSPALLTARRTLDTYKSKWMVEYNSFWPPGGPKLPAANDPLLGLTETMETGLQELSSLLVLLLGVLNEEETIQQQGVQNLIIKETQHSVQGMVHNLMLVADGSSQSSSIQEVLQPHAAKLTAAAATVHDPESLIKLSSLVQKFVVQVANAMVASSAAAASSTTALELLEEVSLLSQTL